MKYTGGMHQFTEQEMRYRVLKVLPKIAWNGGVDILVTHSPAFEIKDGVDLPHMGFKVFRTLLDRFKPKYFLHGHVHMRYGRKHKRIDMYKETRIINACERYEFEY